MKKFTTGEIRDLFNQVMHEEISFSRMVEVINERVEEPRFKDGDFLHSDWDNENITIICSKIHGSHIYYHASKTNSTGLSFEKNAYWPNNGDFRHATEEEKQEMLDALAKEGKRWNEEKKCVEDIPVHKFRTGDKVRIKDGVSSETHRLIPPGFTTSMDELIGKELTVDVCAVGEVYIEESGYKFNEDWLEPYVEELKKGDLAIFWGSDKGSAFIGKYDCFIRNVPFPHRDHIGNVWRKAIKFESIEQYERFIRGEI